MALSKYGVPDHPACTVTLDGGHWNTLWEDKSHCKHKFGNFFSATLSVVEFRPQGFKGRVFWAECFNQETGYLTAFSLFLITVLEKAEHFPQLRFKNCLT